MTPDKIYTDGRNFSQMPIFEEEERIEYIRKDALLELAKTQKSCEQGFEDGEAEHGYKSALNDLIKQTESIKTQEKEYVVRQLITQIRGELDYIELYCRKQREKIEELEKLLEEV